MLPFDAFGIRFLTGHLLAGFIPSTHDDRKLRRRRVSEGANAGAARTALFAILASNIVHGERFRQMAAIIERDPSHEPSLVP